VVGLGWSLLVWVRAARPVEDWIRTGRGREGAAEAWRTAVRLPQLGLSITIWRAVLLTAAPVAAYIWLANDLSLTGGLTVLGVMLTAAIYPTVLNYFALELYLRPVAQDIGRHLPPRFELGEDGVPLRAKLLVALPLINVVTGAFVGALSTEGRATLADLGAHTLLAIVVSFTASLLLTLLVLRTVLTPVRDLLDATRRIRKGDMLARVPPISDDEMGHLASSFNEMMDGVFEREMLREALGSYVTPDVARRVVREGSLLEGQQAEVTMFFVDIRGFTEYSEHATPEEAVGHLNRFFDLIVPVLAEHGGHANKFVGDGLLGVFGTPEYHEDHADRAFRAASRIAELVRETYAGKLSVGIGMNSGRVLAGTVGGGGRLEFMLIGDPVNVAARVERLTRQTGDVMLVSEATRGLLSEHARAQLDERGEVRVKGKADPVRVYAARPAGVGPTARLLNGFQGELSPVA
jgi:adenylate cyclase